MKGCMIVTAAWIIAVVGAVAFMVTTDHRGLGDPVGIPVAIAMILFVGIANKIAGPL